MCFSKCCYFLNSVTLHAFVDSAKTTVVHLIGAVKDDNVLAKTAAHVLGGLSLTSTSWTCRCSTECHAKSLRQRDVTPV